MLPGFTATASTYRARRSYAVTRPAARRTASAGPATVLAASGCDLYGGGFLCDCVGVDDCNDLWDSGICSIYAACESQPGDAGNPYCWCLAA
jgi:hypothetical protein